MKLGNNRGHTFTAITLLLLALFAFSSCLRTFDEDTSATLVTVAGTNVSQSHTTTGIETPNANESSTTASYTLPGEIVLEEDHYEERKELLGFAPRYRTCYYTISGFIRDIVDNEKFYEFSKVYGKDNPFGYEKKEMEVKVFVKYFDIPKKSLKKRFNKKLLSALKREMIFPEKNLKSQILILFTLLTMK